MRIVYESLVKSVTLKEGLTLDLDLLPLYKWLHEIADELREEKDEREELGAEESDEKPDIHQAIPDKIIKKMLIGPKPKDVSYDDIRCALSGEDREALMDRDMSEEQKLATKFAILRAWMPIISVNYLDTAPGIIRLKKNPEDTPQCMWNEHESVLTLALPNTLQNNNAETHSKLERQLTMNIGAQIYRDLKNAGASHIDESIDAFFDDPARLERVRKILDLNPITPVSDDREQRFAQALDLYDQVREELERLSSRRGCIGFLFKGERLTPREQARISQGMDEIFGLFAFEAKRAHEMYTPRRGMHY